jgi:hypothetical protein
MILSCALALALVAQIPYAFYLDVKESRGPIRQLGNVALEGSLAKWKTLRVANL